MSRSARLLALMQALRRRRHAARAEDLAEELGISTRTVYRDIATLVGEGAPIEGAAGLGYVLRPGFFLPPLMLGEEELDAILLGLKLVERRGDADLGEAAENALAKIIAVLPAEREATADGHGLLVPADRPDGTRHMATLRQAIRQEQRLRLRYTDKKGEDTDRIIWPIAIGFFETSEVMAAWCETREDFRHFRLDSIAAAELLESRYPRRRRVLLAEWRAGNDTDDGY
jgi:predicted DNA-binding transcriptional regulator YafY